MFLSSNSLWPSFVAPVKFRTRLEENNDPRTRCKKDCEERWTSIFTLFPEDDDVIDFFFRGEAALSLPFAAYG